MRPNDRRSARPADVASRLLVVAALATSIALGDEPPELPAKNAAVVAFAVDRLGEKVGNGQCTSLAIEALRAGGARGLRKGGDDEVDYEWGTPVDRPADLLPGDVLQFRDAVFESSRRIGEGRSFTIESRTRTFPHHTAIVEEVRREGRELVILHQNTGPTDAPETERQLVQRDTLKMYDLQPGGSIWAYRPVGDDRDRLESKYQPANPDR